METISTIFYTVLYVTILTLLIIFLLFQIVKGTRELRDWAREGKKERETERRMRKKESLRD